MTAVMTSAGATGDTLPVAANWLAVSHGEDFVGSKSEGGKGVVPKHGGCAFNDLVGMAAETNGTGRVGPTTCACLKVRFHVPDQRLDIGLDVKRSSP